MPRLVSASKKCRESGSTEQLDALALLGLRPPVDPGDQRRVRARIGAGGRVLVADVPRQLARLVGVGGRGVDAQVEDDLGAERLAQLDLGREGLLRVAVLVEGGVLQPLRPDARR